MAGTELASAGLGLLLLVAALAGWVAVQSAWRRSFPDPGGEPDALAGRGSCAGCRGSECSNQCDNGSATRPDVAGRQER